LPGDPAEAVISPTTNKTEGIKPSVLSCQASSRIGYDNVMPLIVP